jgi:hypothetical protein
MIDNSPGNPVISMAGWGRERREYGKQKRKHGGNACLQIQDILWGRRGSSLQAERL